jgi:hypothetical protein
MTNALRAYVDCVTYSIYVKIYGRWINTIWYESLKNKATKLPHNKIKLFGYVEVKVQQAR